MAAKKSTPPKESFMEKITGSNFLGSIVELLKMFTGDFIKEFITTIENRLVEIEKKILANIFSGILIVISILFLAIAAVQLIPHYIDMPPGMGYLIIGAALLLWAFVIKYNIKR